MQPRDYQLKVAELAKIHPRAGFEMVTGAGKTFAMALVMQALQLRTLVVVPTLQLKNQLAEVFSDLFGSTKGFAVHNIDSPELQKCTNYDVLILDECHRSASTTYRTLNKGAWRNIYHRYFFSGTFFRSQYEESLLLEGIAGAPCYKFGYHEAVKAGAIVPIESYHYVLPKQKVVGDRNSYQAVYSELVVNNKHRNLLIASLLGRAHQSGVSSLCLVKEIKHGQLLSDLTFFPFANGQDGQSESLIKAFNSGEVKTLIATTGVCAEGVDTKLAEYLFLAGGGKAKVQFMQMVGRVLRPCEGKETGKIVLIKDPSHKWMLNHFNACLDHLKKEYGVKSTQLTFD